MYRQNVLLIITIITFGIQSLSAQQNEFTEKGISKVEKVSVFSEFEGQELTTIEIETNLEQLYSDRRYQNYHPSFINITFPDGDTMQQGIKTRTRGKFRCRNCDYPPIKMKFPKRALKDRNYKKWNEYKMVYPCKPGQSFQNYIYKEYLTYKIYNLLSDKSYQVELVDLTIKDSLGNLEELNFKGFIIEDRDELAVRLDCAKEPVENIPPKELASEEYALFQVFQFMIGNTDWIPPIGHNLDILKCEDGALYPIPFDFDFSGLVGTHYAIPNSNFPISSINERYFMGHKKDLKEIESVLEIFKSKKDEIYQLIRDFEYLPSSEKFVMIDFLKGFYRIIEKPKKTQKAFDIELPVKMRAFY